jgi:D-alanyl-D-alanine carboxypeptidase
MAETGKEQWVVLDPKGNVVDGENYDALEDPASTTKVWTLHTLAREKGLDFIEIHRDLVTRMMRDSSNVAAYQLAYLAGGGSEQDALYKGAEKLSAHVNVAAKSAIDTSLQVKKFIGMMNDQARENGISNTNFMNPDGYPVEGHYSTSKDMAAMMLQLKEGYPSLLPYSSSITTDGKDELLGVNVIAGKTGLGTSGAQGSGKRFAMVGCTNDGYVFAIAGASRQARKNLAHKMQKMSFDKDSGSAYVSREHESSEEKHSPLAKVTHLIGDNVPAFENWPDGLKIVLALLAVFGGFATMRAVMSEIMDDLLPALRVGNKSAESGRSV